MRLTLASAGILAIVSMPAYGITAYSLSDPSLQGTQIASEQFTVGIPGIPDGGPPPMLAGYIDEKVIRNVSGTLDFYIRFVSATSATVDLSQITFSPVNVRDPNFIVRNMGFLSDGPGVAAPYAAGILVAGNPLAQPYFYFGFASLNSFSAPLGSEGSKYAIMRSQALSYDSTGFLSVQLSGDFFTYHGALIPSAADAAVPEPISLLLLPTAIFALLFRYELARLPRPVLPLNIRLFFALQ